MDEQDRHAALERVWDAIARALADGLTELFAHDLEDPARATGARLAAGEVALIVTATEIKVVGAELAAMIAPN